MEAIYLIGSHTGSGLIRTSNLEIISLQERDVGPRILSIAKKQNNQPSDSSIITRWFFGQNVARGARHGIAYVRNWPAPSAPVPLRLGLTRSVRRSRHLASVMAS